jgi:hypothetical protein
VREQVTVVGNTPIVRAETASLGTVVEHEQVVRCPERPTVHARRDRPRRRVTPNSVLPRTNGVGLVNEYLFDGISVLQPEPGQVRIPNR